ncbi:hypothetical protein FKP32DRAFT_1589236 [Trametes sanguinea]|nr:hypothetical protein FKP32DRAFT_1589236 [Trametes sanguinea]
MILPRRSLIRGTTTLPPLQIRPSSASRYSGSRAARRFRTEFSISPRPSRIRSIRRSAPSTTARNHSSFSTTTSSPSASPAS